MIITKDNLSDFPAILTSLYDDLQEINVNSGFQLEIHYQDWHNEYSAERTDPCPDYYGTYGLFKKEDMIINELVLSELDLVLCVLSNLYE